jgi:hypothetical protein
VDGDWCRRTPLHASSAPLGDVLALVRSGRSLVVSGCFTSIGDKPRSGLALVDAQSGRVARWHPLVHQTGDTPCVYTLGVWGRTLYFSGYFDHVARHPRFRLAAVDLATGGATAWDPDPDTNIHGDSVSGIALGDGSVFAYGAFGHIGRARRDGFAALDLEAGHALPIASQRIQRPLVLGHEIYLPGRGTPREWRPLRIRYPNVVAVGNGTVLVAVPKGERYILRAYDLATSRRLSLHSPVFSKAACAAAFSGAEIVAGGDFAVTAK